MSIMNVHHYHCFYFSSLVLVKFFIHFSIIRAIEFHTSEHDFGLTLFQGQSARKMMLIIIFAWPANLKLRVVHRKNFAQNAFCVCVTGLY